MPQLSPAFFRILPFAVYIAFLALEWMIGRSTWLYPVQIGATVLALAWCWRSCKELHEVRAVPGREWIIAAVLGVLVFVLWINLDLPWMSFGEGRAGAAWADAGSVQLAMRVFGVVLVVPVIEELFWRSFLMRWLDKSAFWTLAPYAISWRSLIIASLAFGAEHHLWLAGIVAGLIYGQQYRARGWLLPVVLAHALTNGLLEFWVHRTGNWQFL